MRLDARGLRVEPAFDEVEQLFVGEAGRAPIVRFSAQDRSSSSLGSSFPAPVAEEAIGQELARHQERTGGRARLDEQHHVLDALQNQDLHGVPLFDG